MEKQENLHLIDEIIKKIKNDSRIVNENDLQNMETIELSYSGDLMPVDFLLDYFNEIIDKQKENETEKLKIWLNEFEKLINWHRERSLLPYDWDDYEHKKIMELREMLK